MHKFFTVCFAAAIFFILSVSVSAAPLNWEDFVYTYDDSEVGCIIPADRSYNVYFNGTQGIAETYGGSSQYLYPAGSTPRIQVWPFGKDTVMSLDNIPYGTPLTWSVRYSTDGSAVTTVLHGNFITYVSYFDANMSGIGTTILEQGEDTLPYDVDITLTLDYPSNAKFFRVWTFLQGWDTFSSGVLITLECTPVAMLLGIEDYSPPGGSSAAGLILGGLIAAGKVDPNIADRFAAIGNADQLLLEKWSQYTDDYVSWSLQADELLRDHGHQFFELGFLFDQLFNIPFFTDILIVSLTLGIGGFILNLSINHDIFRPDFRRSSSGGGGKNELSRK